MKSFSLVALGVLLAANQTAGPETAVKQRAKELRDQHNVRQCVPPSPPPSPSSAPAARPQPESPQSPATTIRPGPGPVFAAKPDRLLASLAQVSGPNATKAEQIDQLAHELMALAPPSAQPTHVAVHRLARSLATALAQTATAPTNLNSLAGNLRTALRDGATLPSANAQALPADVQANLQVLGVKRTDAVKVADELKTVLREMQTAARR